MNKALGFKPLREALNLQQAEMGSILGRHPSSISKIEAGEMPLSKANIKRIQKLFPNISLKFLESGEGPMLTGGTLEDMKIKISAGKNLGTGSFTITQSKGGKSGEPSGEIELGVLRKENEMLKALLESKDELLESKNALLESKNELIAELKRKMP